RVRAPHAGPAADHLLRERLARVLLTRVLLRDRVVRWALRLALRGVARETGRLAHHRQAGVQSLVAERAPPHLVIGPHHHALAWELPFGRRAVFFVLRLDAVADRLAPVEETAMLRFEEAHLRWCVADVNRGPCLAACPV